MPASACCRGGGSRCCCRSWSVEAAGPPHEPDRRLHHRREALRAGLVTEVVAHADLLPTAHRIARRIAANDHDAVRTLLDSYRRIELTQLAAGYDIEGRTSRDWLARGFAPPRSRDAGGRSSTGAAPRTPLNERNAVLTGDQYKASLDDGRSTYFEGGKVTDLPGHPVLGTVVQNIADGYDWLALKAVDGVSPLSGVPATVEQLREKVELVHTAGMMAHVNYSSLMTLTTAAGRLAESSPQYVERIRAYVDDAQERDIRVTQCITDAKGDRSLPPPGRTTRTPTSAWSTGRPTGS